MTRKKNDPIAELLVMLASANVDDRVTAINALGEIGNADALQRLRDRMKIVSNEHIALIAAIGKLKRKLSVR